MFWPGRALIALALASTPRKETIMKTETKSPTLYWSERGCVACATHTPFRGTDTWVWERWKRITPAEAEAFRREVGRAPECETCRAIARQQSRSAD